MALIKCPECNREISDTAEACPFCGCNPKKIEQFEKKVISLGDVPSRTKTRGLALMVMSLVAFPVGIATVALIIGIFIIIGAIYMFIVGFSLLTEKKQEGNCPYCGERLNVPKTDSEKMTKCPVCNNLIKQTANTFENIH